MRAQLGVLVLWLAGCAGEFVGPKTPIALGPSGAGAGSGAGPSTGTGGGAQEPGKPPLFACAAAADPSPNPLRRLTRTQYRNALEDLLGRAFSPSQVQALLNSSAVAPRLAALPVDGTGGKHLAYDSEDQRVSTLLVEPQLDVATAVGEWVAGDAARLRAFATAFSQGADCTTPTASACVNAVISGLGLRALRRPLDAADGDLAAYRGIYDATDYGGYKALIAAYLLAPGFLFRTEFKGSAVEGRDDLSALSPFELASRVSFAITNSIPDEALLAAAQANFQGAGLTIAEQTDRLLATPRARAQFEHFFRQWLRFDRIPAFNPSAAAMLPLEYPDRSAAPLPADLDLAALRTNAYEELVTLMNFYAFDKPNGSLREAVTSELSFARTADVAAIYGVPVWSGSLEPAALVKLPAGQRAGLFTRAGYLLSGYPDTNPVIRGARLRVEYLCDAMQVPADTSPPASYVPPAVPTTRNLVVAKTEIAGTACKACHATSINPLGFPLESYDTFGRYRTQEALHDAQGKVSSWVPVDAVTAPDLDRQGNPDTVNGGVALSNLLSTSERFHGCFARDSFRYLMGQAESFSSGAATDDGCTLAALTQAARTGSLQDVARSLTTSRAFGLRKLQP